MIISNNNVFFNSAAYSLPCLILEPRTYKRYFPLYAPKTCRERQIGTLAASNDRKPKSRKQQRQTEPDR